MKGFVPRLTVSASIAATMILMLVGEQAAQAQSPGAEKNSTSAQDFESIVPVLRHPRCMNCHSTGDYPRQGNDSHPHSMDVKRGSDGHGTNAVQCAICHQDHNLAGPHMPPGAPGWGLPPPSIAMLWEGLTDIQLCQLLKDPSRNGNRTVAQVALHMRTPLVAWGFHPGEGRTPVPMTYQAFLQKVNNWVVKGANCPQVR